MMANTYLDRASKADNFSFFRCLFSRPRGLEFKKGFFKEDLKKKPAAGEKFFLICILLMFTTIYANMLRAGRVYVCCTFL